MAAHPVLIQRLSNAGESKVHKHLCSICHDFWRCGCPDCAPEGVIDPVIDGFRVIPEMKDLKPGREELCSPHFVASKRIIHVGFHRPVAK
jgi:hypothetical protein